jgi:hypothetical protein
LILNAHPGGLHILEQLLHPPKPNRQLYQAMATRRFPFPKSTILIFSFANQGIIYVSAKYKNSLSDFVKHKLMLIAMLIVTNFIIDNKDTCRYI